MKDSYVEILIDKFREISLPKLKGTLCVVGYVDSFFPVCYISRKGESLLCKPQENIYTKFWPHKFHASVYAEAMVRSVRRFAAEGNPVSKPKIENQDDTDFDISWILTLPSSTSNSDVIDAIRSCWLLVRDRAFRMIKEDADSVLLLGKDTGIGLARLKKIEAVLQDLGYDVYIVKEQPDRLGESIIQKVLRYALRSRFVLIENTEASGHLYEVPHVAKMAECVTAMLQEEGKGATWMFEDAYGKSKSWKKFSYQSRRLRSAVIAACEWAQLALKEFGDHQKRVLPWLNK